MPKYLKIAPDPDARVCHCGDWNPDCDHLESCDGCGMDYRKHEGHDCIDGVPVQDLRAMSKELRDALDACETERDRLRSELDAAHDAARDGEDALRSEVDCLRAQVAALHGVELTDEELDSIYPEGRSLGTYHHEIHRLLLRRVIAAGIKKRLIAGSARLAPTPTQAAPGAVVEVHPEEFRRDDRYIVLKRTDLERHATPAQLRELERTCGMVRAGRATEGKRLKSYVVVADNWPEYEETWAKIQARVTGIPQPLQPEERRVVAPEPPEESELYDTLGDEDCEASYEAVSSYLMGWRHCCDALRTSAQAHNGEESK